MIIIGDIAIPNQELGQLVRKAFSEAEFNNNQAVIFNLEGLLADNYKLSDPSPVLFNHSSVQNVFEDFEVKIAAIANNHTLDLPHKLEDTKKTLKQNGFLTVGAGSKSDLDFEVTSFVEQGKNIYLFNACWDFLLYHQNSKNDNLTVNIINEQKLLERLKSIKQKDKDAIVVFYFHWSFDLEILPFPSYREFSKALIDNGASLVAGGHSHCIQGGERYKDGYIVYGLGNFFIPNGVYANGNLNFPEMSNLGLVLEWDIVSNNLYCHWFKYSYTNNLHSLVKVGRDLFDHSETLSKHSPFNTLSHKEYISYFKNNRRKKKLIPIFNNYNSTIENKLKMYLLKSRAQFARRFAKLGLIKWQN